MENYFGFPNLVFLVIAGNLISNNEGNFSLALGFISFISRPIFSSVCSFSFLLSKNSTGANHITLAAKKSEHEEIGYVYVRLMVSLTSLF